MRWAPLLAPLIAASEYFRPLTFQDAVPALELMAECTFSCPHCGKHSVVQTYGGMSGIYSMNCGQCPICIHVDIYDPHFSPVYLRYLGYTAQLEKAIEEMLNPCTCGGAFRAKAPYRCRHCSTPFSRDEVIKHIDRHVGYLVMDKAVDAKNFWKRPKEKLTPTDQLVKKARIGQVVASQWVTVLRALLRGKT
jgi:hypothetical protein